MSHARYDVAVVGGGPAGATTAALLARNTPYRVAVFEQDTFPREHIGESLAYRAIPPLQESGALAAVLDSDCYLKKLGGYYVWDYDKPLVTRFEHAAWERDGIVRWALNVNRADFDKILLDHARASGAAVFEGVGVESATLAADGTRLALSDGSHVSCRIVVEATGRRTHLLGDSRRDYLSEYKNIAMWTHLTGGNLAQSVDRPWNSFAGEADSIIANFAFEDGWVWYIPVPRTIDGERVLTHSIGLVTDPQVLQHPGKQYTDFATFWDKVRTIPILADLIAGARPVSEQLITATNYSMISGRFCDLGQGWIRVGDAAYFVDPLFSSGVTFAVNHAASAAELIKVALDDSVPARDVAELWHDYDEVWHTIARSFAVSIDQWYHAIARQNPGSVYWGRRADVPRFDIRHQTFQALVDTAVTPDLLRTITGGSTNVEDLDAEGPLARILARFGEREPDASARISLNPDVKVRDSRTLDIVPKAARLPGKAEPSDTAIAQYWADPVRHGDAVPPLFAPARTCRRYYFERDPDKAQVKVDGWNEGTTHLHEQLTAGVSYGELRESLDERAVSVLRRLVLADMIAVEGAPTVSAVKADSQ